MYKRDDLYPVWKELYINRNISPGGTEIVLGVILYCGENKQWPDVAELDEMLGQSSSHRGTLKVSLDELESHEITVSDPGEYTKDYNTEVSLTDEFIISINGILKQHDLPALPHTVAEKS